MPERGPNDPPYAGRTFLADAATGMFVFGAQYLRGMTPPPEDWDGDMAMMREMGFNTIRAWLVWGVLEPRKGRVDLASLDKFLDLAGKHDLKTGFLFHLRGAPEWAVRAHRDYWYVDKRGRRFEPVTRNNTPSGGWPGLCPDHAEVREMEETFISTVAAHVGDRPELTFWEPMNEPHSWVDLEESPPLCFCYCPATRAAFQAWLREKYGDLDALCDAWGRRMGEWEEARPPTWKFFGADWVDWRTFAAESIAGHVARRAETIRARSSRPVIAHAWGGGCASCGQLGAMAFDDWKNAQPVEKWGYSGFPNTPEATLMVGFGTDVTRGAARGKEFWQAELGAGDSGHGFTKLGRVPPEWLAMWTWESLRHGAKGVLYWSFRKETQGSEFGVEGFVDAARRPMDTGRAARRIARVLDRNASLFHAAQPEPAQAALLFSYQSYMADWAQHRDNLLSVDAGAGYYRIFWENDIPVDFVHDEFATAEQLRKYRLVVLPAPVALHGRVRPLLKQYAANGGTLLSDPFMCALDEKTRMDSEIPGGGFDAVFGCHMVRVRNADKDVVDIQWRQRTMRLRHSKFQEWYELREGAEALAAYADGKPAIVANRFGEGAAILAGVNLGMTESQRLTIGDDFARDGGGEAQSSGRAIVLDIARDAGVNPPLATPPDVRAGLLHAPGDRTILIAINTTDGARSGTIRFTQLRPVGAEDILDGEELRPAADGLELTFRPYQTRVVLLRTRSLTAGTAPGARRASATSRRRRGSTG